MWRVRETESGIILGFCFGDLEGQSRIEMGGGGNQLRRGMLSFKCVWVSGEVSGKPLERDTRSDKPEMQVNIREPITCG